MWSVRHGCTRELLVRWQVENYVWARRGAGTPLYYNVQSTSDSRSGLFFGWDFSILKAFRVEDKLSSGSLLYLVCQAVNFSLVGGV